MNRLKDWLGDDDPALCFQEGFRAFVKHLGKEGGNPYRRGTTAYRAYRDGWCHAGQTLMQEGRGGESARLSAASVAVSALLRSH